VGGVVEMPADATVVLVGAVVGSVSLVAGMAGSCLPHPANSPAAAASLRKSRREITCVKCCFAIIDLTVQLW